MGYATHITDWTKQTAADLAKRSLKYVIEPSTIYPGDVVTISIFDVSSYGLESPYNELSDKTIGLTNDEKSETLSFSGSADNHSEFPIYALENITCQFEIVDEVSREIIHARGESLTDVVAVVAGDLVANFGTGIKPHGSAKLLYSTVKAQIWQHKAFSAAGNAMLFALKSGEIDYENIPLTISERVDSSATGTLSIVGWQAERSYFGQSSAALQKPYAVFRILGATDKLQIKVDVGTVGNKKIVDHQIIGEEVTLDGSGKISTKYTPKALKSFQGIFNDKKGDLISATIYYSGNVLHVATDKFGKATVSYTTSVLQYDYYSHFEHHPGKIDEETIGTVIAKDGEAFTSYDIPSHIWGKSIETVIEVTYEIVRSPAGVFEMPKGFKSNPPIVTYIGESFSPQSLLDRYSGYAVETLTVEYGTWDGFFVTMNENPENKLNRLPFNQWSEIVWPDRKYTVTKKIPSGASPSIETELNAIETMLRDKYPSSKLKDE
jgi:hypothetical protein